MGIDPSSARIMASQNWQMPQHGFSENIMLEPSQASMAREPGFSRILMNVKERCGLTQISLHPSENVIAIDAIEEKSLQLAKLLLESHFRNQYKLMQVRERLLETQQNFYHVQGEVASRCYQEVKVNPNLLGYIIGKGGKNIHNLEQKFSVSVLVDHSG